MSIEYVSTTVYGVRFEYKDDFISFIKSYCDTNNLSLEDEIDELIDNGLIIDNTYNGDYFYLGRYKHQGRLMFSMVIDDCNYFLFNDEQKSEVNAILKKYNIDIEPKTYSFVDYE